MRFRQLDAGISLGVESKVSDVVDQDVALKFFSSTIPVCLPPCSPMRISPKAVSKPLIECFLF